MKPQGANTNFASSSESHMVSSHPCQNMNRRTVASCAAKPDPTSQYSSIPKSDEMRKTACAPSRTGSRESSKGSGVHNAVHRGSKRYVNQPKLMTGTNVITNQAPPIVHRNASRTSRVQSSTVFDRLERSSDHIPRSHVSIEGISSVVHPTLGHARSTPEVVLAGIAGAEGIKSEAKHPTIEPCVNLGDLTGRGSDFFPAYIPL
jgi:hypothetical protein